MLLLCVSLLSAVCAQYVDDVSRHKMYPLAVAAFDKKPETCIRSGIPDGKLRRQIQVNCDILNDTCSGYTAFSLQSSNGGFEVAMEVIDTLFERKVDFPGGGKVAAYFYDAFLGIWNAGLKDDFLALRSLLGAAMAALSAGFIAANNLAPANQIKLYTYGEPRNGDPAHTEMMDRLLPNVYRVVHNRDIVPHLPLGAAMDYRHHKTEIWYPNDMPVGANFTICAGDESANCSEGLPLWKWDIGSHTFYFDIDITKFQLSGCKYH